MTTAEWGVIWGAYKDDPGHVWTEGIDGLSDSEAAAAFEVRRFPHQDGRVVCRTVTEWAAPTVAAGED